MVLGNLPGHIQCRYASMVTGGRLDRLNFEITGRKINTLRHIACRIDVAITGLHRMVHQYANIQFDIGTFEHIYIWFNPCCSNHQRSG